MFQLISIQNDIQLVAFVVNSISHKMVYLTSTLNSQFNKNNESDIFSVDFELGFCFDSKIC